MFNTHTTLYKLNLDLELNIKYNFELIELLPVIIYSETQKKRIDCSICVFIMEHTFYLAKLSYRDTQIFAQNRCKLFGLHTWHIMI